MTLTPPDSTPESSSKLNGINTDNMSSSRSRDRRRSSAGRKSFSSEEESPLHTKINTPPEESRSSNGLKKVSSTVSLHKPPKSPGHTTNLRTKQENGEAGGKKGNRGSGIVLDVNSILDQLMGGDFDDLDEDLPPVSQKKEKETVKPKPQSPSKLSPLLTRSAKPPVSPEKTPNTPPQVKPKASVVEDPPKTAITTAITPKTSPSHSAFGEELPKFNLRTRRSRQKEEEAPKKDTEKTVSGYDKKFISKSSSSILESSPKTSPKPSPSVSKRETTETKPRPPSPKQEYKISAEEQEQLNMRGVVSQSRRKDSMLINGFPEEEDDKFDDKPYRMRARSTAVSGTRDRLKVQAYQEFSQDVEKMEREKLQAKTRRKNRPASAMPGEVSIGRSGSFKRRQQMDGDRALGLFYHNRHSQLMDHDTLDEAERHLSRGPSLEYSDSDPRSPHAAEELQSSR